EEHEGEAEHAFERRWYNEREEVEHEAEAEVEEAREEAKHAGAEEQHFEELLALRPPPDVVLLAGYRERAADAAARYTKAHAQAYRAYQAELAVTRLAEESKAMAESGKPIHKRAQGMKGPIEKSKSDEAQRKSKLDGNDTGDVKGADSKMGGLVVDLISKLADNSDHLSQRPDGGGVKGDDMAGSQDKAASEGKERTEQSKSHSSSQQQFLDQALQVRAQQEASVAQNIQSLEGKSREEFAIRDAIRVQKAQALAEEAAARDEAESNAAQFNEGYARAAAWAETYEAKRKEKSSGGAE
ncbi:MAG TPA: hypothetical protein VFS15_08620, partial [Kofleriaceae bacterium]|nr:hypothetical protein [Kofleriaceae bacterium]